MTILVEILYLVRLPSRSYWCQIFFNEKLFIILLCNNKITNGQHNRFVFSTGATGHITDLTWSIAGNMQGQSPNILSELTFKNITGFGGYLDGVYTPTKYTELNAFYQLSGIVSGKGTDVDYQDDNRTHPTFNGTFSSNNGRMEVFRTGANVYFIHKEKLKIKARILIQEAPSNVS